MTVITSSTARFESLFRCTEPTRRARDCATRRANERSADANGRGKRVRRFLCDRCARVKTLEVSRARVKTRHVEKTRRVGKRVAEFERTDARASVESTREGGGA